MDKYAALERIKDAWQDDSLPLGDKVIEISSCFYAEGLDLESTAAFIKATPAEFDFLLAMGEFDDETLSSLSEVNPPKTTWAFLVSANEDEVKQAITFLKSTKQNKNDNNPSPASELVYKSMLEISGPTPEQKIQNLSSYVINHIHKKGADFKALSDWESKFLKNIAAQKKRGKTLSEKQSKALLKVFNSLADKEVITRNSIDRDQKICDEILDIIGR